jgi:diguanylate cyclase (GGDEF)-like protein
MPQASHGPADSTLEMRTLLAEHEQLFTENLEYMAVLSRYARALGLCSTLGLEALAERIVEGLCLETRAQGGLLWIARDDRGGSLRLATVRGVLKARDELETISAEAPPIGLEALRDAGSGAFRGPPATGAGAGTGEALYVRLRHGGRLLGVARVSDRLDASAFDARDLAGAEQFAEIAALALSNALRFRTMERSSLRDPRTRAYTPAFFDGVVATELEKAHRFGRHFSLLEIELSGMPAVRARLGEAAASVLVDAFAERLQQALRGTDICAVDGETRYRLLLAETDALGAAALKRRIRSLVEPAVPGGAGDAAVPTLRLAATTFPADGTRVAELTRCLARRLEEEGRSVARVLERECRSFAESRLRLLREAGAVPPQLPEQALRFVLDELRQRPHQRGLTWISPGASLRTAALDGLARLRGRALRSEIVLLGDEDPQALLGVPATCIPARRLGPRAPFLVHLGETQTYACLRERDGEDSPVFHSSDRVLVEHLAFQLQRDLGRQIAA